jgi:hypothetical protein
MNYLAESNELSSEALLTNLEIRNKLLLDLLPLALMVIVAGLYSSIENKKIDTLYSDLIDNDIKALQSVGGTRPLTMRFGLDLYQAIAELNPDRTQSINRELDKTYADYEALIAEALRHSPDHADRGVESKSQTTDVLRGSYSKRVDRLVRHRRRSRASSGSTVSLSGIRVSEVVPSR